MWARGGDHRTELPVTSLGRMGWIITVASGISTWAICLLVFNSIYEDARHLAWDSSIVGASIAAQVLMTYKKRECWFLWTVPVNLSSVGLYLATGNWAFLFLYLVFTANSVWAWSDWNRSLRTP
jgi:nicotinamide mononucleotide transporter